MYGSAERQYLLRGLSQVECGVRSRLPKDHFTRLPPTRAFRQETMPCHFVAGEQTSGSEISPLQALLLFFQF